MATNAPAIDALCKATGISEWILDRITRPMRPLDQWVAGGQGGGRNARHVDKHHLAYIVLAMAVWYLREDDPKATAKVGAMVPAPEGASFFGIRGATVGEGKPFLPGNTLVETLSLYIAAAATPEGRDRVAHEHFSVAVYRHGGSLAYAGLYAFRNGLNGWGAVSCLYQPSEPEMQLSRTEAPHPAQLQISFNAGLIQALADLYADTLIQTSSKTERRPSARKAGARG